MPDIHPFRTQYISAIWRFGNGREIDCSQSSLTGSSGPDANSRSGQPQHTTLSRVTKVKEISNAFGPHLPTPLKQNHAHVSPGIVDSQ